MTIDELQREVQQYVDSGYSKDVASAAAAAQVATKYYIQRTHPSTAFGGKKINGYIIKGSYKIENKGVIKANIYANYFARWYSTGAIGRAIRGRGPLQGQTGPTYPARGAYFNANFEAIQQYFMDYIVNYLKEHISL